MLNFLYERLETKAAGRIIAGIFVVCLLCSLGFEWRKYILKAETLDPRYLGYDAHKIVDLFKTLNEVKYETPRITNLELYAISELTLDLIFPVAYSFLLALLISKIFRERWGKYLVLLPIFAGLADLCENSTIAYLAFNFNAQTFPIKYPEGTISPVANLASIFTSVKSVLLFISLILTVVGAIFPLRKHKLGIE